MRRTIGMLPFLWLIGCASFHYSHSASLVALEEGKPIPLRIDAWMNKGEQVTGALFYRRRGDLDFRMLPMMQDETVLKGEIPGEFARGGAVIEYYFEFGRSRGVEQLGSPEKPYHVLVLSRMQWIAGRSFVRGSGTRAGRPVYFVLQPGVDGVESASVFYQGPIDPAELEVRMQWTKGGKSMEAQVPGERVKAGPWAYRVEMTVEGTKVKVPPTGYKMFQVKP